MALKKATKDKENVIKLTYSFEYEGKHKDLLLRQCEIAKNLYNQALYVFKQSLKENSEKWLFYKDLEKIMRITPNLEGEINFKLFLVAHCAQQCLRRLDEDIRSSCKAIKDRKMHKEKYRGMPKLPNFVRGKYKEVIFPDPPIIKNGCWQLRANPRIMIKIPQWKWLRKRAAKICQFRVVPHNGGKIRIDVVYEAYPIKETETTDKRVNTATIDIGVNNLAAIAIDNGKAYLISGKPIKAINQRYNKKRAKYKSLLDKGENNKKEEDRKRTTKRLRTFDDKRQRQIKYQMHCVSKTVVSILQKENVGFLYVGHNKNWKQKVNLGKQTNQKFVSIPFNMFIDQLEYKCKNVGIVCKPQEESYTSQASALDCDPIPVYKEGDNTKYAFSGKRIIPRLYKTKNGILINADVNGALNIMHKVVGDTRFSEIANNGLWLNPIRVNQFVGAT